MVAPDGRAYVVLTRSALPIVGALGRDSREPRPAARQWTTNRKETDMTDVGLLYVGGVLFVNTV